MTATEIQCLQMQANDQRKNNPDYAGTKMSPEEDVTILVKSWNHCGRFLGVSTLVY